MMVLRNIPKTKNPSPDLCPMVLFPVEGRSACPSKNALLQLLLLSTCTTINSRGAVAFVSPQMRSRVGVSASILRCNHRNALPEQLGHSSRWPRRQQQSSLLRAAAEGSGGGAGVEGEGGKRGADDGAASGMGLEGEWEVKSGEGKKAREGSVGDDGVSSVPGQLPDKDWAAWAREWREDPQGKADRLLEKWDAESKANGGAGFKDADNSKKRNSKKKKKKGKGGPSRGVVSTGFGGAVRQSKSVPKGLVVEETGTSKGDVVDWSTGQQLVESDRKDNMAADWEQDAKRLESLGQSDREELADKLRMALGKNNKPRKRRTRAGGGDGSKGFSTATTAAAGGKPNKHGGDGRGALASAAGAAGAVVAEDVAGVSVFPAATAAAADQGDRQPPPSGRADGRNVALLGDENSRHGDNKSLTGFGRGVAIVEPVADNAGSDNSSTSSNSSRMDPPGRVLNKAAQIAERHSEGSAEIGSDHKAPSSVPNLGKGVFIPSEAALQGGGEENPRIVLDGAAGSAQSPSAAVSSNSESSNAQNFGRGVSMPAESAVEEVAEEERRVEAKDKQGAAADDIRVGVFGRGVAFPIEPDADG